MKEVQFAEAELSCMFIVSFWAALWRKKECHTIYI